MSLVQIGYQTVLTKLRDWGKIENNKDKLELLQQASSLMGQGFRVALYILQQKPHRVTIEDYHMFFSMVLDGSKFLLFKSNSRVRLNDCTCKESWVRKGGQHSPYMCIHQILLELVHHVFPYKVIINKVEPKGTQQLSELLDMIS